MLDMQALDMLHVICSQLHPVNLSICVGDGSRPRKKSVKNLELHLWMQLLLLLLLLSSHHTLSAETDEYKI